MRVLLLAVLLAATCLPVLGEVAPRLDLTYPALTVEGPQGTTGFLQALEYAPTKDKTETSRLHLEAQELRVHVMQDATVYVPGGIASSQPATTDSDSYLSAVVDAQQLAPDYYLAVVPRPHLEAPQITVVGDCAQTKAAEAGAWSPLAFATPRDWLDVSTVIERAFDVGECGRIDAIRIQGHFILTHWQWQQDLTAQNVDGKATSQQQRSGYEAAQNGAAGTSTQVYLVVTDGFVEFLPGEAKAPFLALAQPVLEGQDLHLRGTPLDAAAIGTTAKVPRGDFTARGINQLVFGWHSNDDFNLQVQGDAAPSSVQPASQGIYAVGRHADWLGWALAGLVAGLLVVVARKPWLWPQTHPSDVLERANVDYANGRFRGAVFIARYAAWRGADAAESFAVVGYAYRSLGRNGQALQWFGKAIGRCEDPEDLARLNFAAFVAAAMEGDAVQAADRLNSAANLDAGYLALARQSLAFDAVKDHAAFQDILGRLVAAGNGGA